MSYLKTLHIQIIAISRLILHRTIYLTIYTLQYILQYTLQYTLQFTPQYTVQYTLPKGKDHYISYMRLIIQQE
jgi:hypothetical protein